MTSALARACHPLPALGVTAVAAGLIAGTGRPVAAAVAATAAVFAGQLSVGWLNDLVDAQRDAQVGRAGKPVAAGRSARWPSVSPWRRPLSPPWSSRSCPGRPLVRRT
ncbi:hypothetical protein GCM10029992_47880 [Glycomyces albus]